MYNGVRNQKKNNMNVDGDSSVSAQQSIVLPCEYDVRAGLRMLIKNHIDILIRQESVTFENRLRPIILQKSKVDSLYQEYRLSMIAWFVWSLDRSQRNNTLIITAIDLMDRYITCCAHNDVNIPSLLRDTRLIGTTCLIMANKMFDGDLFVNMKDTTTRVPETPKRSGMSHKYVDLRWTQHADLDDTTVAKWERAIAVRLNGRLFMVEIDRVINVICTYIIQAAKGLSASFFSTRVHSTKAICERARSYFIKTVLDAATYLHFHRWQRIAGACLLAVKHNTHTEDEEALEKITKDLFIDMGYVDGASGVVECSRVLCDYDCLICFVTFPSKDMTTALRYIAGSYCESCIDKYLHC